MRIQSFSVQGFANLTGTVTFGPLQEINILYGPNNAGKSNLLRAIELYFRLLGSSEVVTKVQPQTFERVDDDLKALLARSFNRRDPQPITFRVEWSVPEQDLQEAGLFPELPGTQILTELGLATANRAMEMRVQKWMIGDKDVAAMDRARDAAAVGYAQQLRRLLSDARPFKFERPVLPYARVAENVELFPQPLRDALFDARQSVASEPRKRWALFSELASTLRAELGEGSWDTAFERATGRADLVYVQEDEALTLDELGSGIQRLAGLLAQLSLAQEGWICLEEPEWRLSPDLQKRFVAMARKIIQSGIGPRQLFITTHSPTLAALGVPFCMEVVEGAPVIEQKPWALSEAAGGPGAEAAADGGLGDLIGLVESLAEIDPNQLVAGASQGASPSASREWQPGQGTERRA